MAAEKKNILTYEGLRKLEEELQDLKLNRRKDVAEKIKEAREQGDLSENAEYDAAKQEQGFVEAEIKELTEKLQHVVLIEDGASTSEVSIGNTVIIKDIEFDEEVEYRIVGTTEADIMAGKISNESPLGRAIIGKKAGCFQA